MVSPFFQRLALFGIALAAVGFALAFPCVFMAHGAETKPYYGYPDATAIPDNARFLMYDPVNGSRNATGAQVKTLVTPDWANVQNKPSFAAVATSGNYADLSNKPAIPGTAAEIGYSNPTYTTVAAALDQLLYVAPSITGHTNRITYGTSSPYNQNVSGTASSNTVEIGNTVSKVELFWTLNKTVTTQSIDNGIGALDPSLRAYTHNATFTGSRTYTLTVGDGTNTDTTPTTTIYLYARRHWGAASVALASFTSADILSLASNEFSTSHTKTGLTYNCTGGRYPTFAFPSSWGTLTSVKVGGLSFTDYSYRTISHTNASGYVQNYYVYQFNNLQTGSSIAVDWD